MSVKITIGNGKIGKELINILDIIPVCCFCGHKITEETFGGIYNRDNTAVVVCKSLLCLLELRDEIEHDL